MRSRARGGKRYRNRTMRGGKFNPLKTALTAQAAIPQAQKGLQKLQQVTKPENIAKINRAVNVATPALVAASSGALNPATISAAQKAVGKAANLVQTHGSKVEEGLNKASKVDLSQMVPAAAANPCAGKVGDDLLDCEAANEHGPAMTPSGGKSRRRKRRGRKSRKHRKRRTRRRGGMLVPGGLISGTGKVGSRLLQKKAPRRQDLAAFIPGAAGVVVQHAVSGGKKRRRTRRRKSRKSRR